VRGVALASATIELVEDERLLQGIDARASISNRRDNLAVLGLGADVDGSAGWGVLGGVFDQVS